MSRSNLTLGLVALLNFCSPSIDQNSNAYASSNLVNSIQVKSDEQSALKSEGELTRTQRKYVVGSTFFIVAAYIAGVVLAERRCRRKNIDDYCP